MKQAAIQRAKQTSSNFLKRVMAPPLGGHRFYPAHLTKKTSENAALSFQTEGNQKRTQQIIFSADIG